MKKTLLLVAIASIFLSSCKQEDSSHIAEYVLSIDATDYASAERLLEQNAVGLVKNPTVTPHWLGDTAQFWYKRDGDTGEEYTVVDVTTGKKSLAFDHAALAAALGQVLDAEPSADALGLAAETLSPDLSTLTALAGTQSLTCQLQDAVCQLNEPSSIPPGTLVSPNGRYILERRADNFWLTDTTTETTRQLTTDGEPYKSWGKLPDTGLLVVQIKKYGMQLSPVGAQFSPNERYLVASLNDERQVGEIPFVEWVPTDGSLRPIVHMVRHPFTGDANRPEISLFSFDLETGTQIPINLPEGYFFGGLDGNVLDWSTGRGQAFVVARTYGSQKVALFRVELATGETSKIIEDVSATRAMTNTVEYNKPNIRVLGDGDEVIWYSDRSGWGHLYLYDAQSGALKNTITEGAWLVQDIHAVDEDRREVYFTGGAREPERDPYFRHLYRAPLDGGDLTLLTKANADHVFVPEATEMFALLFGIPKLDPAIRPDLGVFIDSYSTVDTPPRTVLRSTRDGSEIAVLELADASALYAAGWVPPIRQPVTAADGKTEIYTVYYPPKRELPGGKHPVIDAVYGGPQVIVAPRNFMDAVVGGNPVGRQALTRLGFAVVTTDGRGTPLRDNAFRDVGYPEFTRIGIEDHMAAIRQLAEQHPEMDTARVGIYGWSWGGTFTGQAMLSRPDFYDVGITGAGVYDYAPLYPGFENTTGVPMYADETSTRTRPDEKPINWEKLDITAMAENLAGKMLIIYGDMDENVPQTQAFRLIDALIKANKPYDLLYLPNRTHGGLREGYVIQRHFDYFVEHLLGTEPPTAHNITIQQ